MFGVKGCGMAFGNCFVLLVLSLSRWNRNCRGENEANYMFKPTPELSLRLLWLGAGAA